MKGGTTVDTSRLDAEAAVTAQWEALPADAQKQALAARLDAQPAATLLDEDATGRGYRPNPPG